MKENNTQKHFDVRVSDEIHRQTKLKACMLGISIQEYINNLLVRDLQQPEETNK